MAQVSLAESRADQIYPQFDARELERMRRFGEARHAHAGQRVVSVGEPGKGLALILKGRVRIASRTTPDAPIIVHGPGNIQGELAQLSGGPYLVDGVAETDVEVLLIPTARLRDLMIEEADLGERIMRALILRRTLLIQEHVGGPLIIGKPGDRDVLRLENFLERNAHPYELHDPDSDEKARGILEGFHVDPSDLPAVLCPNGTLLRNPSENQLARCLGLDRYIDAATVYDVAIVGAGPAGLSTAVYAASEGLSVLVLDSRAFGGQAGASARIENYLGFPTGIRGLGLMARAYVQAQKFGAEMAIPDEAARLEGEDTFSIGLQNGERVTARSVVIASGAHYRSLDVPGLSEYEGSHVHYWASPIEGKLCSGEEVALVGGGNSAGQAAVYLSGQARKVWVLARGKSLEATMSSYLCERIAACSNIEVLTHTTVTGLEGEHGALKAVHWKNSASGEETVRPIRHLFLLIGADPNTDWLAQSGIAVDQKGFVHADPFASERCPFETSRRGVFAVGDVRAGSTKRVAAAVGEGAQVVASLHAWLARRATAVPKATQG